MDNLSGWAALIIAATGLLAGVGAFVKLLVELSKIHTIVNSQKTAMQTEIDSLRSLVEKSVERDVPVSPAAAASVPPAISVSEAKFPPPPKKP